MAALEQVQQAAGAGDHTLDFGGGESLDLFLEVHAAIHRELGHVLVVDHLHELLLDLLGQLAGRRDDEDLGVALTLRVGLLI
eukprot:CAMPEP_0116899046 /NCGR_PEP_ID=MMETSP0467-20121206/7688_1 /TAXON_ID=283647 /ORGANISM="Mesodinium pulex, Strain SPMC105" /LENGTH=81 /DNA_ID=CAMNT_0004571621 /DNA_START=3470 /DNA_END=3715 /DNA_ORIENTATION=-